MDEVWGCFKHVGMSWDMIMKLPIQDRRALIQKHNREQEEITLNLIKQIVMEVVGITRAK